MLEAELLACGQEASYSDPVWEKALAVLKAKAGNKYWTPWKNPLFALGFSEHDDPEILLKFETIGWQSGLSGGQIPVTGLARKKSIAVPGYARSLYGFTQTTSVDWTQTNGLYIEVDNLRYFILRGFYDENDNTLRLLVQLARYSGTKLIKMWRFDWDGNLPEGTILISNKKEFSLLCISPTAGMISGVTPEGLPYSLPSAQAFAVLREQIESKLNAIRQHLANLDYILRYRSYLLTKDLYDRLIAEYTSFNQRFAEIERALKERLNYMQEYAAQAGKGEESSELIMAWQKELQEIREIIDKDVVDMEQKLLGILREAGKAAGVSETYPGGVTAAAGAAQNWIPVILVGVGVGVALLLTARKGGE